MKQVLNSPRSCLLLMLVLLISVPLSAQWWKGETVKGSGKVVEEERSLTGFNAVHVSEGIDLVLRQGNTEAVIVKADDNVLKYIRTIVEGKTLKIDMDGGNIRSARDLQVDVTFREIERIEGSSGSDIVSDGTISASTLQIRMSSGSDLKVDVEAEELICELSSGSDAILQGRVGTLIIEASSGSDVRAKDLKAVNGRLRVSGGSDAWVQVTGELEMEASGASDISFTGNPRVLSQKSSGASDIRGN